MVLLRTGTSNESFGYLTRPEVEAWRACLSAFTSVCAHPLEGPPHKLHCFSGGCVGEGMREGAGMTAILPIAGKRRYEYIVFILPMSLDLLFPT